MADVKVGGKPAVGLDRVTPELMPNVGLFIRGGRQGMVDLLAERRGNSRKPALAITMPCGERYEFKKPADLPTETLPCRCGDPECVVVDLEQF